MTVLQIGILALTALVIGRLKKGRELALLAVNVLVIYWLQPPQQFVSLAYWLPTATVALTVLTWALVSVPEARNWAQNWPAALVIAAVILLVDLNQFFGFDKFYMTTTPRVWMALLALGGILLLTLALQKLPKRGFALGASMTGVIVLFIYLKAPVLVNKSFEFIHSLRGQESAGSAHMIAWLGFSYVAFRLLHTLRDYQTNRLPSLSLAEYVNYVIFFPSFTAGPIDRAERFVKELRAPLQIEERDWLEAGTRLFAGLFKKFVLADALAVIALNDALVGQVKSAGWMWIFLYAYSLRIYFDFSGYTDIAIGIARLLGIRLPENFSAPYLKPNLTQFWNSWHMTLTQWFRAYFFNPLTRALRSSHRPLPVTSIIFVTQISTMTLIGLWHGVTWGFVLWGLWHGVGLFVQNRWSDFMRGKLPAWAQGTGGQRALDWLGIFATFHFVSLGWLFFTLSSPSLAWQALLKLFGLGA